MPLSPGERKKEGILILVLKRHSVFKSQGKNAKHLEWRTFSAQSFEYNWDGLCSTWWCTAMGSCPQQPLPVSLCPTLAMFSPCALHPVYRWHKCLHSQALKNHLGGANIYQKWGYARAPPLLGRGSLSQCAGCSVSGRRPTSSHL